MRSVKLALCSVALLGLSACVTTEWQKPGAGQSEYEQVKANCMIEGHNNVPVQEQIVMVPGSQSRSQSCNKHGCSEYGSYAPPHPESYDANADLRAQVVKACFYRNGWQEVQVDRPLF